MADFYFVFGVWVFLIGLFGLWASKHWPEKLMATAITVVGCYLLYLASCATGIFCIPPVLINIAKYLISHIPSWR